MLLPLWGGRVARDRSCCTEGVRQSRVDHVEAVQCSDQWIARFGRASKEEPVTRSRHRDEQPRDRKRSLVLVLLRVLTTMRRWGDLTVVESRQEHDLELESFGPVVR